MSLLSSLVGSLIQSQETPYVKPKRAARPAPLNKGKRLQARARRAYAFRHQLETESFFKRG